MVTIHVLPHFARVFEYLKYPAQHTLLVSMRGPRCITPTASDFTPPGSTIDTPASTHAVSDKSYRGDTILPSIEVSGQQPLTNNVTVSSVPLSGTTGSQRLSPTPSTDQWSCTPSHSTRSGVSSIQHYQASFTFRSLYNATPEPTSGLPDSPSQPSTVANNEAISEQSQQSEASAKGLSNSFQRLDVDASLVSENKVFYDVKDEIPPSEPYFDPAFQESLKKGVRLAGKIATCLQQCDLAQKVDSDLHKLYRTARELESFESPARRTIGVVGDSATGNACPNKSIGMVLIISSCCRQE